MFKQFDISKYGKNIFFAIFIFACISFVDKRQERKECTDVQVAIVNDVENYFLSDVDIMALASLRGKDQIVGGKLIHIPLKTIEKRIESNKFVESVQVDKDHLGNLNISVKQSRPIARIFYKDTSFYIGSKGRLLPLSKRYTSRVLTIEGKGINQYLKISNAQEEVDSAFFEFLKIVDNDAFFKAQIAGIDIDEHGDVTLLPQVTKQEILFGKPEYIEEKFKKMELLYSTILPDKGWNYYSKVNVKFKDQIICE